MLTRPELLRLLCDATLSTLYLTGTGQPESLSLGRSVRTVTKAQWTVLQARDRDCVVKGCHQPAHASQAHHVQHWANGGPTDLDNLVLLCHHHHHHHIHDQHLTLEHHDGRAFGPDGWTDPRSLPWTRNPP